MFEFCLICFIIGALLGFLIQRGFFCMYNGITNMIITKDYRILRATIWAFLITLIGFHTLAGMDIITLKPKEFFLLGSFLGAIMFGIGMFLSGSCIVGTPMRAGMGRIAYWFTLFGMGIGGYLVIWGPLAELRKRIREATIFKFNGETTTLDKILHLNSWVVVIILAIISIYLLIKFKDKKRDNEAENKKTLNEKIFKTLWSGFYIGLGLGFIEIFAYLTGKSPAGLGGFIKGYAFYIKSLTETKFSLGGWPGSEITGIIFGAFLASLLSGEFRIIWPKDIKQVIRLFIGGLFMGMGAVIAAGGCNVAHIISHMPQLSVGSFISAGTMFLTTYILITINFKKRLKKSK